MDPPRFAISTPHEGDPAILGIVGDWLGQWALVLQFLPESIQRRFIA